MSTPARTRLPGWLLGGSVIALCMGVMNVATYGFTILAARLLGPSHYGALAALMGLLLVINVVSLGLQATAARRVSASPEHTPTIERDILSAGYRSAATLGVLCLVATPAIDVVLRLDSWVTAALVAVTAVPLTVMGGQAGVLQGERRWTPLALMYLMSGLGRLACGAAAMVWRPDALGAMLGVAVGAFFPAVVGWFALRNPRRRSGDRAGEVELPQRRLLGEVAHNSHALLAFFALSNADVVIGRMTLDEHDAGLYAAGLILAKAVLFLPQFVVVVAFPSMSSAAADRARHLKSLALVLGIGAVAVIGAWALSGLAVVFVGGPEYAAMRSSLWAFAGLGTLLAMLQLMVYHVLARQQQRTVFVIRGALAALLATAPLMGSPTGLLAVVVTVDGVLLGVLVALSLRSSVAAPAAPARDASLAK
jgi:O-antigen/teichoic acid export membrane protein